MDCRDLARKARKAINAGNCEVVKKRIFAGGVLCVLCLYINQAQSSQSEAEAVAALCDTMRYQAYSTMELRQFSTPKYKLKEMVDRNMTNVNSRMTQYKLISEAYAIELVSPERADFVAQEFAENQRKKCMKEQGM
ncbi:hypothetical protein HX815_18815 [Pseudomonas sp. E6002]|uniref:hypothetical protein n=1 Tax=Pseudomonas sp. E6002 TaxID=2738820 RepID=UPI0015A43CAF|nr:hypothetical protein [Pseudomonas sp. E6002]NWB42369.1 hypothetical protein [Pseudomonas sp. E6002]